MADNSQTPEQGDYVVIQVGPGKFAVFNKKTKKQSPQTFGSAQEAETYMGALNSEQNSPANQAMQQTQATNEAVAGKVPEISGPVWEYQPGQNADLTKSEQRKRLEEIAFQNQGTLDQDQRQKRNQAELLKTISSPWNPTARGVFDYDPSGVSVANNPAIPGYTPPVGGRPQRNETPPPWSPSPQAPGNEIPMMEGVYDGTWAQGRLTPEQHMRVISGEMTPEAAVQMMTNDSYGADYQRMLTDIYGSYVPLYSMSNGGNVPTDEAMIFGQGGDMTLGWTNSDRAEANVDYGQLWDNQYSPEYMDFMSTVPKSSEEEYKMIQQNVNALETYTTPEAAGIVRARVDDAYTDYIASGYTGTFTQYLRDIGADQWL